MNADPARQLTLFDAVSIIVGIVIGAGIYETTPAIAGAVATPAGLMGLWLLGSLLSLIGALCYAELATTYPEEGGDYVFLNRAYGPKLAFLFAWSGFWVVRPANIGAVAYIFARYASELAPPAGGFVTWAAAAVIALSIANILGVRSGKTTQNLLTVLTVAGLLGVIAAGLAATGPAAVPAHGHGAGHNYYLALILVLFTYGGWSNIAYVAAEVRRPETNLLRSLVTGVLVITVIYILVNLAFVHVLGLAGMTASDSVAADTLRAVTGGAGGIFISALICITCLGNLNGMLLTESRIYYALGRDNRAYGFLGTWSRRLDSPLWSLTLQAAVALAMIVTLGGDGNAFERLVILSAPLFWLFVLLVGIALFVFRRRGAGGKSVYRVPFYPWLPAVFCLCTGFILYASLVYAWQQRYMEGVWVGIVLLTGILASFWRHETTESTEDTE